MSYHLFLDDERQPHHVTWVALPYATWHCVHNFETFREAINLYGVPKFVTFDHDLAPEHYEAMLRENLYAPHDKADYGTEKTGYDCAKWLVEYCHQTNTPFPKFQVHSMNPIGAANIKGYIQSALDAGHIS